MSNDADRCIYACDIGSTRPTPSRFGWARVTPDKPNEVIGSSDIDKLVECLKRDLGDGRSIALGFEAPLFIPVPELASDLSKGRDGDGNRSFAAPAGLTVAMLAVHQAAWILREIRRPTSQPNITFTTDWRSWPPGGTSPILFCWEAFVVGEAHSEEHDSKKHVQDAATAAACFCENECSLEEANAVKKTERPLSLIGAIALWSEWDRDLEALHRCTLVIKPKRSMRDG